MEFNYEYILVRFGELNTKGKNKRDFIKKLMENIKFILKDFGNLKFERTHDRIYIILNGEDTKQIIPLLSSVFGISSFSLAIKSDNDIEKIIEAALEAAKQEVIEGATTFKVDTRRSYKQYPMISDEINRAIASRVLKETTLKVDVHKPSFKLIVEVHQEQTYIMAHTIKGAGGFPVGVGGKGLVMLSGGIDSPIAGYEAMKRGVHIECIHYASPPYTSSQAIDKVLTLAKIICKYQGSIKVHIIPFTETQLAIYQNCDESYAITIMRRMMYRLAHQLAIKQNCLAIVNGESIGQVASQTLESMMVINDVTNMPVIRPLATMDKEEIVKLARKIGTYETSILPFEDCCTIFTPKNPVTKPKLDKVEKFEAGFDYQSYLDKALEETQTVIINYREKDIIDKLG